MLMPGHRKPLNIAHQGASAYAPGNTLAAFRLALEMGADGFELDVMLSADGYLVVIHDDTVDHTTDGSGPVRQKTLAELKALDAGIRFDARFTGERIPTLQEVLNLWQETMSSSTWRSRPILPRAMGWKSSWWR